MEPVKVVVRYVNGKRVKGFSQDFFPNKALRIAEEGGDIYSKAYSSLDKKNIGCPSIIQACNILCVNHQSVSQVVRYE